MFCKLRKTAFSLSTVRAVGPSWLARVLPCPPSEGAFDTTPSVHSALNPCNELGEGHARPCNLDDRLHGPVHQLSTSYLSISLTNSL